MKKISTLFKKDPNNLGRVINEINPDNLWALEDETIPSIKRDGTACAIINGSYYKRYDAKIDIKTGKYKRNKPIIGIPCQEPDLITGHHPHWIPVFVEDKSNKYHVEAFEALENPKDGTYELCGPKINGNPEKLSSHKLIKHGTEVLFIGEKTFDNIKKFLTSHDIEGIVFTQGDKMCKIRKKDFGIKR